MNGVRAVVVQGRFEGQVGDVVEDVEDGETDDDDGALLVVMLQTDVEAQSDSVDHAGRNIKLTDTVIFELVLKLAVMLRAGAFQGQ